MGLVSLFIWRKVVRTWGDVLELREFFQYSEDGFVYSKFHESSFPTYSFFFFSIFISVVVLP